MAKKKPSASSRPAKLISVSAESIFSKPPSKAQKAILSRIAKRQAAGDDSGIDYSDIPPLTDEQLAQLQGVIERHLARFAFRDPPTFIWRPARETNAAASEAEHS